MSLEGIAVIIYSAVLYSVGHITSWDEFQYGVTKKSNISSHGEFILTLSHLFHCLFTLSDKILHLT